MRSLDLTPLMRSSVGFDDLFRLAEARLDSASQSYPPYNIEKLGDDEYRVTMAVAGFSADELDVVLEDRVLTVTGRATEEDDSRTFLHRGIAKRAFERTFRLAETVEVKGAGFENGLLTISLERRVPEHMKPRQITIEKGSPKASVLASGDKAVAEKTAA
ncbi:heat-shock protein IbpA [Iodidimonas muriae]|uniref:Heat-shock protein IbpA n=2 Tax=Iodidimonas TaxID=2066486 RepID=A0A5A7N1E3_9PROT|nr:MULTISPECIES: Hsp20 family protein [Iodidimonas]GER01837.1 heat-shock protein IbpA [Iodidimonas gelatinilytica]GER06858.1 heat-shock protein IbpA [Kordiimonadales bacterium JCM 17843]GGO09747.1 heat-shock protein IbpA [Iodidimonas muriae]